MAFSSFSLCARSTAVSNTYGSIAFGFRKMTNVIDCQSIRSTEVTAIYGGRASMLALLFNASFLALDFTVVVWSQRLATGSKKADLQMDCC